MVSMYGSETMLVLSKVLSASGQLPLQHRRAYLLPALQVLQTNLDQQQDELIRQSHLIRQQICGYLESLGAARPLTPYEIGMLDAESDFEIAEWATKFGVAVRTPETLAQLRSLMQQYSNLTHEEEDVQLVQALTESIVETIETDSRWIVSCLAATQPKSAS